MKIDFEAPLNKSFHKSFSKKEFREYQHYKANNQGMLEIKPHNENQKYLVHSSNYETLTRREV
jgi:hypothetical protein